MQNRPNQPGGLSRRRFLQLSAASAGVLALAACAPVGPGAAPAEGGEPAAAATGIRFLTQGGNDTDFLRYEPLIENFQATNPDLTIEAIWEPGGAIEVQTKLLTLIAAGDAPDIYWAHSYTNGGQAKRDIQMDLTDMIAADDSVSEDNFLAAAYKDFGINGRQVGFPRETTSTVLIYNMALFDKAGLDMPNDTWTWADFANAAAAITEGEGAEKVYGTADWNLNRNTWIKMWQKGGDVLSADRTSYTMNQEISVAQVQEIANWHHDLGVHIPGVEMGGFTTGDLFTTGRIGMFPQFSVFSSVRASEFEWDIAHLPVDAGDTRTTRVASAGHSMYSGTDKPDAAWKWIAYLTSDEAFWHWVRETGLNVPSNKNVASDPEFINADGQPPSAQIMLDAFDYGRPEPVSGDWIGVHREVQPALDSIYGVEKADVQSALDGIAERVNELIAFVPGE